MRKSSQLLAAVTVVGIAIAGSTAFTGTGLTNSAGDSQFIGGTVVQSVTGATLAGLGYNFTNDTHTAINGIDLWFDSNAQGHVVSVLAADGNNNTGIFDCPPVGTVTAGLSHCTYVPGSEGSSNSTGYTGLISVAVTVGPLAS